MTLQTFNCPGLWMIRLTFLFLLVTLASVPAVLADDSSASPAASSTTTEVPVTPTPPSASSTPGQPIQGGVKMVEVSLENLRDLGLDLKHVMSGASHIYDEVNIAPVSLQTVPEVIGRGIVINIPIGTTPIGPPAPPRKSRLDLAMHEISPIITLLKTDVDAFLSGQQRLDIDENTRAEIRPVFESWAKSVTSMATVLTSLDTLTAGPKFDNGAISQAAQQLQANCKILQKDLKKIYKTFQREGKKSRKS